MLDAFHRGAFVKLVSRRATISTPWTDIESTVQFWKLPKTDSPRTCNCREGQTSLAAVSVRVGCKRQYKSSSRSSARRMEVWTLCYQYTNIFPVLPFCFKLASTELHVPLLLPLVTTGGAILAGAPWNETGLLALPLPGWYGTVWAELCVTPPLNSYIKVLTPDLRMWLKLELGSLRR